MSGLYLGRQVDPATMKPFAEPAMLDPDQLTQHAVCLGMTGSGKTGLCVTVLEELAMTGVPILAIDPKGDLANLALAFAEHRAEDFAPWVDPVEAERAGKTTEAYAEDVSERWRKGLREWGVDAARIRAFTDGTEVTVYTPGSTTGVPINVLGSLGQAPLGLDDEGLTDLVGGTVASLLGLLGIEADPLRDPRHIVPARILGDAWHAGETLALEDLIVKLVDPPFEKVGVFPLEQFFGRKDRMDLAMQLNGLVASPSFAAWSAGHTLDFDALLAQDGGRTPIRVFCLSHLDDAERTFFAALLLNGLVAWCRRQPGSGALRALAYFDEVFGYLPPYPKNPPTKKPILTLMKQARAVGVGAMLVTQNPVDVDYKALSNAGLWIMGRLSTKQDRDRVLDGLSGAAGEVDKATMAGWLDSLPSRTFVVRDVKRREPYLLHSRWAISYLRGPLTLREIERLDQSVSAPTGEFPPMDKPTADDGLQSQPPPSPSGYSYRFVDPRVAFSARLSPFFESRHLGPRQDGETVWEPALHAQLHLRFDQGEYELERGESRLFFPIGDDVRFDAEPPFERSDFLASKPTGLFTQLPASVDEQKELKALSKQVAEEVYRGETERMFVHTKRKMRSRGGETLEAFTERVRAALQDKIDAEVAKMKESVDRKLARLEDRQVKLERNVERYRDEERQQVANEVVNVGETLMGLFFGRRKSLNTAMSKRSQTRRAQEKTERSTAELQDLQRDIYDLETEVDTKVTEIENKWLRQLDEIEEKPVRLERADIRLDEFGIVWVPVTRPL